MNRSGKKRTVYEAALSQSDDEKAAEVDAVPAADVEENEPVHAREVKEPDQPQHVDRYEGLMQNQRAESRGRRCVCKWVFFQVALALSMIVVVITVAGFHSSKFYYYVICASATFGFLLVIIPPQFEPHYPIEHRPKAVSNNHRYVKAAIVSDRIPYVISTAFTGISIWFTVLTVLLFTLRAANWLTVSGMDKVAAAVALLVSIGCSLSAQMRSVSFWLLLTTIVAWLVLASTATSVPTAGPAQPTTPPTNGSEGGTSTNTTAPPDTFSQKSMSTWSAALAVSLPFGLLIIITIIFCVWWQKLKDHAEVAFSRIYFDTAAAFAVVLPFVALWIQGDRWRTHFEEVDTVAYTAVFAAVAVMICLRLIYGILWARGEEFFTRKSTTMLEAAKYACCGCLTGHRLDDDDDDYDDSHAAA